MNLKIEKYRWHKTQVRIDNARVPSPGVKQGEVVWVIRDHDTGRYYYWAYLHEYVGAVCANLERTMPDKMEEYDNYFKPLPERVSSRMS